VHSTPSRLASGLFLPRLQQGERLFCGAFNLPDGYLTTSSSAAPGFARDSTITVVDPTTEGVTSVIDSGAHLFMSGQFYYRHIDDLALSVCAVEQLTDARWREYIEGSHALSKQRGSVPKVTAIFFAHDYPNASQRRMTAKFIADNAIPNVVRNAVFTESVALRGAMTAFNWFIQDTALRAFAPHDVRGGLTWLREVGNFDVAQALDIWREGHVKVGLPLHALR
jgi:hypothetical protein